MGSQDNNQWYLTQVKPGFKRGHQPLFILSGYFTDSSTPSYPMVFRADHSDDGSGVRSCARNLIHTYHKVLKDLWKGLVKIINHNKVAVE
ncbi:hypothetical protein AYI68_g1453 [Smittium mucronatum]|uniref:Uncharacterized protein n=1 Tax=Smittium mucronatum TaxID=133383 RepID=A0A1R0H5D0_9FUNG|nr:hypothetical protein AYI68_g1453 [Smittium mucronatum]